MSTSSKLPGILFLILFSYLSGYASSYHNLDQSESDSVDFVLKELRYGRVEAERVGKVPNNTSPTGTSGILRNYEFTSLTDTIPAKLHVNFGVEFVLESDEMLAVPLTVVWKFPTNITNDVNKNFYQVSRTSQVVTNHLLFYSYKFDQHYEVKAGIWEVEIYHKNKLLYSRQFHLMLEI